MIIAAWSPQLLTLKYEMNSGSKYLSDLENVESVSLFEYK